MNCYGTMVLAGLLVSSGFFVSCKQKSEAQAELPSPTSSALPKVQVPALEQAKSGTAAAEDGTGFRGTGTLYPREKAELGPKITGVITRITVDEGDTVKKNQLMFAVDSRQAQLGVEQAKATLNAAKIQLSSAELDFQRTKELFDRGSVPPATFDQVKARYDGAKTQVEQAKVALSQATKGAVDTAVYSPLNGVVSAKLKSVGELATVMPPTVVLVVQDVSVLELRARLPERALGELAPGTRFKTRFPAIGTERELTIKRINPTVDARARTIEVIAEVDNADRKLRPGMLVEVHFDDAAKEDEKAAPEQTDSKRAEAQPADSKQVVGEK